MARGYVDFTRTFTYGEVKIKPSVMFPTGRVVFIDNFESPTRLISGYMSAGGAIAITTAKAFSGSGSLKVIIDDDIADYAGVEEDMFLTEPGKIGVECVATLTATAPQYFEILIQYYDQTNIYDFRVRWDGTNSKWQYYSSVPAWTDVPGGAQKLRPGALYWHRFKVVVDVANVKYGLLYCDGLVLDLSALAGRQTGSGIAPYLRAVVVEYNSLNANQTFYIDNVAVTEED